MAVGWIARTDPERINSPAILKAAMTEVTGFITAGGRSSRMGKDKAWLEISGRPMIEHVAAALAAVTTNVAIIANREEYETLGFPVFADTQTGIGPLEAIRTALTNTRTDRVILVGCDLPFVTSELFKFLLSLSGDHRAVVPIGPQSKPEPLCAIYWRQALATVESLIESGERKVSPLFDLIPTRLVSFEELRSLSGSELFFENINTPEDYASAIETSTRLKAG